MEIRWHEHWLHNHSRQPHDFAPAQWPELSAVVFDFSGILYDNSGWRRLFVRLLGKLGLQTQYELFFRVWERDYLPRVIRGQDYWDTMRQLLREAGLSKGQCDEVIVAGKTCRQQYSQSIRPLPQVRKTLTMLQAADVKLGLVCSCHWNQFQIHQRLKTLRLDTYFPTPIAISDRQDFCMKGAIGTAADQLAAERARTAYVGRTPETLEAAHAAGIIRFAFNHTDDSIADVMLTRFEQLLEVRRLDQPMMAG